MDSYMCVYIIKNIYVWINKKYICLYIYNKYICVCIYNKYIPWTALSDRAAACSGEGYTSPTPKSVSCTKKTVNNKRIYNYNYNDT